MRRAARFVLAACFYLVAYVVTVAAAALVFACAGAAPSFQFEPGALLFTLLLLFQALPIALLIPVIAYETLIVRSRSKRLVLLLLALVATLFIDLGVSRLIYGGVPGDRVPDMPEPPFSSYLLPILIPSFPAGIVAALVWVGLKRVFARVQARLP